MRIFSVVILIFLILTSCQTRDTHPTLEKNSVVSQEIWPQPLSANKKEVLLNHGYFQISYNEVYRLPNWVSYQLKAENLKRKIAKRKNKFFADPMLTVKNIRPVKPTDFDGKKYDRGHMAPSDDFVWDQEANDATFVMSNMAPQTRALNRGSWKNLETSIRKWACTEGELRVVTGPILEGTMAKMNSQVPIPEKFFKVILDETPPRKAIGFIYSQKDSGVEMQEKATSLYAVEQATGYKFFLDVNPQERTPLEKTFDLKSWVETDCMPKRVSKAFL